MLGTQYLGMSDAEWRALTPRLLIARLEKQRELDGEREKLTERRVAFIAAQILNTMRSKDSQKVWTAEDFLPDEGAPKSTEDCDVEGIVQMFRRMGTGLNGN